MIIVEPFLEGFEEFNQHVRQADFTGVVNPLDGVMYPDISVDIPEDVVAKIQAGIDKGMGWKAKINMLFMRNTDTTTPTAPHQAHTDTIQGTHIFLLYMQDGPPGAGTALVSHKELGFDCDPVNQEEFDAWDRDKNVYDAWVQTALVEMVENRAVMGIWSAMMHRAEPIGGFGTSPKDGRIAIIGFYEKADG